MEEPRVSNEKWEESGWIGFDWDGTLVRYTGWVGPEHHGPPIPDMWRRLRNYLSQGYGVRIVTARVGPGNPDAEVCWHSIRAELCRHLGDEVGTTIPVTCQKDFSMIYMYDDRVRQVVPNTGEVIEELVQELKHYRNLVADLESEAETLDESINGIFEED